MNGGDSDMTLAFELAALKELQDPESVFTDARQWTTYVGVISEKPTYVVTNYTRKNRIRQDFFSGPRDRPESLGNIKEQFDTERYVFIGTSEEDKQLADQMDWEYLSVEDAGEAADWQLAVQREPTPVQEEESRDDWP